MGLKERTHFVDKVSLKEAISQKRKACGYCYKQTSSPIAFLPSYCQATTKKGKQCSRKTSSNGYCWQHG
jgi:hypothetical protein